MVDPTARDLISRLADELDHYRQLLTDSRHESHALATEARAYLATEPQGEGPTDEELESVARLAEIQNLKEQGGLTAKDANGVAAMLQRQRLAGLRAVLARWGRPAQPLTPAAEGAWAAVASFAQDMRSRGLAEQAAGDELLKLANHALATEARAYLATEPQGEGPSDEELLGVEELRDAWNAQADAWNSWDELGVDEIICWAQRQALARWGGQPCRCPKPAAALLQQQHPQPVPVSERLPEPRDCDVEGRCWWGAPRDGFADAGWVHRKPGERLSHQTHWLPAHALPLPASGEVG